MATAQTVWGIDVGRSALKAIKLRAGAEGKVEILAHDYIEHEKILSEPDANRQELIAQVLEKFLSRNDITKDQVFVSVPGQHTLSRFTKLPPVAPKRIPDIVRY
jgi:type IV pilus assembly protein PilM